MHKTYPNKFHRTHLVSDLLKGSEALEQSAEQVKIAGRLTRLALMGASTFADLQDMSGTIQLLVRLCDDTRPGVTADMLDAFKHANRGDILGIEGVLMKTKTAVTTVRVTRLVFLSTAMRQLPEKFHGLKDIEQRYRKRYLDLICNQTVRKVFQKRFAIIMQIREFFHARGYCEVETPMMHPIAGGAKAKPFQTHHNALNMDMYLRIAPELYLKRLVVGGFEKVYEINRSFRNEGVSTQHNPEFTMLEMYQAYGNYKTMMALVEELLHQLAAAFYDPLDAGEALRLDQPFQCISMEQAVCNETSLQSDAIHDVVALKAYLKEKRIPYQATEDPGKLLATVFEHGVEQKLIEPVFVTDFPTSISPLARAFDDRPEYAERFELFVGGREIANGFSELNDPVEQKKRFEEQMQARETGDEEAMAYDADYITALEHGMPPTCGAGIGIDRLVMLLTGSDSIRDVILFPHMKYRVNQ